MSTSYYAIGGYGIIIEKSDVRPSIRPSCEHPERVGNRFCPVCGEAVKVIEDSSDWEALVERLDDETNTAAGYIARAVSYDHETYFVGWGAVMNCDEDEGGVITIPSYEAVQSKVLSILGSDFDYLHNPEAFAFYLYGTAS